MVKKLLLILILNLVPLFAGTEAYAQTDFNLQQLPPIQDIVDPIGLKDTTYHRICEIRRMFCRDRVFTLVLIAGTIFGIGCLILVGKARWQFVMVTAVGMSVFLSAEWLFFNFAMLNIAPGVSMPAPVLGVYYSCTCINIP